SIAPMLGGMLLHAPNGRQHAITRNRKQGLRQSRVSASFSANDKLPCICRPVQTSLPVCSDARIRKAGFSSTAQGHHPTPHFFRSSGRLPSYRGRGDSLCFCAVHHGAALSPFRLPRYKSKPKQGCYRRPKSQPFPQPAFPTAQWLRYNRLAPSSGGLLPDGNNIRCPALPRHRQTTPSLPVLRNPQFPWLRLYISLASHRPGIFWRIFAHPKTSPYAHGLLQERIGFHVLSDPVHAQHAAYP